ncbi:MAG: serine hydrolase domain-containing protein [Actinomycetota bacterium]
MSSVKVTIDPEERGFDPVRLGRISAHFRRYVDDRLLPGWQIAVTRGGDTVFADAYGHRDVEAELPVEDDTIFRAYSMTKPITTVAAMMLWEEGAFELKDPVHRYLPSFRDQRIYSSGSALAPATVPTPTPMQIWHLMTHTSGMTYDFLNAHPVDQRYREAGWNWGSPAGMDLAAGVDALAEQPLVFEPGTEWNYSVSTDVLGRLVEVVSGQSLSEFFRTRILGPLGMTDTAFHCSEDRHDRMAALYVANPANGERLRSDAMGNAALAPPTFESGGGGLVTTAGDYLRFADMLRRGGELDGVRLLGTRTLEYMTQNHLPGNADLSEYGRPLFAETAFDGVGFGLGFAVVIDPAATKTLSSVGEFNWGGAASTAFWVDPVEDLTAVFFTQLLPSSTHPLRTQLKQLVYQALVD